MPGLIGFVKSLPQEQAQQLLTNMASALEPENRFQVDLHVEQGYALGRVSLGITNPSPQPLWNAEKNLCIVMEGEIFDYAAQKQRLIERGYKFAIHDDAEFVLHLYEEFEEDFAVQLNGAFIIILWDARTQKLLIANDRLGLHPFYYAQVRGGLIFGSGVRALLADPDLPRTIDPDTLAEIFTFDHALNDSTLVKDVHRYPQASLLTYQQNQLQIRPYWNLKYLDQYEILSEDEYLEQLLFYLRQAVARQKPGNFSAGMLLSGGLDSRFLLALLRDGAEGEPFDTFTWGIPGCDDARFAKEIARALKTQHHFFELQPDWLLHLAQKAVRITDGMGNVINLHALATLEDEAKYAQIIYKGFMGDAMMGYALMRPFWADYTPETERQIHFQAHTSQGVITFPPEEQKKLFTDSFQQQFGVNVLDTYQAGMLRAGSRQLATQRLYFDLTQRVPHLTLTGVEVVRDRAVVRLPFCDNDLLDFSLRVPPGFNFERHLIKNAFIRSYPNLAKIPNTENGLPMITCLRDVRIRTQQILGFHLQKMGLGFIQTEHRPYKDYTTWFRTVLRGWVEDTLLSQTALARGYFNPAFVRQIVTEHMQGSNHTLQLGAFLALELWHQLYMDR